jgi:hypothetical protein
MSRIRPTRTPIRTPTPTRHGTSGQASASTTSPRHRHPGFGRKVSSVILGHFPPESARETSGTVDDDYREVYFDRRRSRAGRLRSVQAVDRRHHGFCGVNDVGNDGPRRYFCCPRYKRSGYWWLDDHQNNGDHDEEEQRNHSGSKHHWPRSRAPLPASLASYGELDTAALNRHASRSATIGVSRKTSLPARSPISSVRATMTRAMATTGVSGKPNGILNK